MTIIEMINKLDSMLQNSCSQINKIDFLSRLDSMAKRLVIDTHEGGENVTFTGYNADTPLDTELLIPNEAVYLRWMEAQIHYHNAEYDAYNNAIELFNTEWEAYRNEYNRNHMPKGHKMRFF
jgi:hypothetical protein